MTDNAPILAKNDPWLEPYTDHISQRLARLNGKIQDIESSSGSVRSYASAHLELGVHYDGAEDKWIIREWAPEALYVGLIGDFNSWDASNYALSKNDSGIWEIEISGELLKHGERIKLHIYGADEVARDRIPATITRVIQETDGIDFSAQIWQPEQPYVWKNKLDLASIGAPLIYEAHVGMAGEEPRLHHYREFADDILPRIVKLGYNTVQLMAVQEHPYYGSFGYHVSSLFAPSSRFGTPEDLKYLIDKAHGLGLAVLIDIIHAHAIKNTAEGLNNFDGSGHQYFHAGEKGDQPQWDSKCYDYGKEEVLRFLLSNIRYWLEEFDFDGFRFDGVTSMLYEHHGEEDLGHYDSYFINGIDEDAILYLSLATTLAKNIKANAIIIAEDMSGMPGLCRPTSEGGIGFTHRLAMGIPDYWIKLLKGSEDENWKPEEIWNVMNNRRQGEATIAYTESHDQALVGDKTLAFRLMDQEMYWHMSTGDEHLAIDRGMAMHKSIRLITHASGGEGWLNFMGNEFGHPEWVDFPREGNDGSYHYCRRQWSLVDNPELRYQQLNHFDQEMISLSKTHKLLSSAPAQQLHVHNEDQILVFERMNLIFIFSFNPEKSFLDYELTVPENGNYRIILDSDSAENGGHQRIDTTRSYPTDSERRLKIYIPNRTCMVLEML